MESCFSMTQILHIVIRLDCADCRVMNGTGIDSFIITVEHWESRVK